MSTTVTERLTGWGDFDDMKLSIRALLFGQMVKRAIPVVQEYLSDLYHDATWITENVNGPMTFDFLVRTSGSNLGDSARAAVQIGAPGGVFYRVDLFNVKGMWSARFTQIPLEEVN